MSGTYSSGFSGPGAVAAVRMAVDDFGGEVLGKPVELVSADHQNQADIASSKARQWIDREKVDVIMDLTNSGSDWRSSNWLRPRASSPSIPVPRRPN